MIFFLFLFISSIYFHNVSPDSSKCYSNDIDCWRSSRLRNLTLPDCNSTEKQTCDEPGNCMTVVGTFDEKPVRYKGCDSKTNKSIFCAPIKNKRLNVSCSFCDYDNCNKGGNLTCYGCSDKPTCINSVNLTCFDDNFSCFSARGYDKYNELVNERGCVPNENIKAEHERYKKKGFTYSACNNSDLCNTVQTGPLLTCLDDHDKKKSCGGHDNFVCINTVKYFRGRRYRGCMIKDAAKEYCKVDNRTGDIPCYVCEKDLCNVEGTFCFECSYYEECISRSSAYNCVNKDNDCFTAKGIKDGEPVLEKGCISKNKIDFASKQYAKRNLSFTTCDGLLCNRERKRVIVCYSCFSSYDCFYESKVAICPTSNFSCISAKGFDKDGEYIVRKHCVFGFFASYECEKYKKRGLSCSVCNRDLCNPPEKPTEDPTEDLTEDPTQDPTEEDDYTEIDDYSRKRDDNPTETDSYHTERMSLSESKVSSISSVILLVTMLTCTLLQTLKL